jgi:hypothetical protein
VALEVHDLGVMHKPVDHGGCHGGSPNTSSQRRTLVGRHYHSRALVARRDELEEQVGFLGVERDLGNLVDDQQRNPPAE